MQHGWNRERKVVDRTDQSERDEMNEAGVEQLQEDGMQWRGAVFLRGKGLGSIDR